MPRTRLTDNSVLQLTLGVHLALLVLLAAVHRFMRSNGWYELDPFRYMTGTCAGVFLAQIGLLAVWAAFSRSSSAVCAGGLLLFVPLLAAVQSQVFNETNMFVWWHTDLEDYRMRYAIWVVELSLRAFAICAIGLGLRCAGVCLVSPNPLHIDQRVWQFRLTDIASWLAVVSMALAAGRWMHGYGWTWRGVEVASWALDGDFWIQAEFALLALLIAAGLLGFKTSRYGLAVALVAPLALSLFNDFLRQDSQVQGMSFLMAQRYFFSKDVTAVMYYFFAAVFGGTLLVVRDRGYRLRWRRPFSSPPVAESP